MSYANQSGSLGYVALSGMLTIVTVGAFWWFFNDYFVTVLVDRPEWSQGSDTTTLARSYVIEAWTWILLIFVLRIGFEAIVASRQQMSTGTIVLASFVLLFIHLFVVLWAYVFPQAIDPMLEIALNNEEVAQAGYDRGIIIARDFGLTYVPCLIALMSDLIYLSAPIRRDSYSGYY